MSHFTPRARGVVRALLPRLAAIVFSAQAASATTWVVDINNGPGTNFTSIGAAIAAASPGDVILVRAGAYFESLVLSKGVNIVGWNANAYPLQVPANPFVDVVWGTLLIQNVPVGQTAVISGITIARPSAVSDVNLGIHQCDGTVVIDRVFCANGGVYVGDSTDVLFQDVRVRHVPATLPPIPGVYVTNAQLQASDLDATATDLGGEPNFEISAPHALFATNGALVALCRPKLIGATGGGPWITSPQTPGGGSAVYCTAGATVSIIGNGNGLYYLVGGQGGVRGVGSAPGIASGFGGPAILVENGGTVVTKGAPTPIPGPPGANLAGGPLGVAPPGVLTLGGAIHTNIPQTPATLVLQGPTMPSTNCLVNYTAAAPFLPFVMVIATNMELSPLPPAVQFLGGDPNSAIFTLAGVANAARKAFIGLNFQPSFAGIDGLAAVIQGADVVGGVFYLTNPSIITLP